MTHFAKVAHQACRAEFGVHVGEVTVDLGSVADRKDEVVASIRGAAERAENFDSVEG